MATTVQPPPGQPAPYAGPPPPYAPPPVGKRSNGLGVAGFVVAVVTVVLGVIPLVGIVAFGLAPIALILCVIALLRKNRAKGLAIAGTILAVIAVVAAGFWYAALHHVASALATKPAVSSTIGATVRSGDFTFKVTSFRCGVKSVGPGGFSKPQGQYCIAALTVKNVGTSAGSLIASSQTLIDTAGSKYDTDGGADALLPGADAIFTTINPGNQVAAQIAFDVPKTFKADHLNLRPGFGVLTDGVNVALAGTK